MTKFQHAVNTIPFLGVALIIILGAVLLADSALAIGWFLSILEIHSIFERLLPSWTAMDYSIASIGGGLLVKMLAKGLPD